MSSCQWLNAAEAAPVLPCSPSGLAVLQRILDTAAERSWQVTSVNLDSLTEPAFIKLLADLDYKKDFQIIIDCELKRLNYILNLVKHWNQTSGLHSVCMRITAWYFWGPTVMILWISMKFYQRSGVRSQKCWLYSYYYNFCIFIFSR